MWNGWINPDAGMRMKPFWFWNGELTREEISRQIGEMAEKGLGGFFICARQGVTAAYQSEEWYSLTAHAIEYAKRYGLEAWLYDEFPYPSGMAGGEMMLRLPGGKAKHIVRTVLNAGDVDKRKALQWGDILCAVTAPIKDGEMDLGMALDISDKLGIVQPVDVYQRTGLTAYNDKRYFSYEPTWALEWEIPENWRAEIYIAVHAGKFKYYGDYFDPGAEGAAQAFIDSTHEKMKKFLGEKLSGAMGIFTDETAFLSDIPYTATLFEKFKKKYGREPVLPIVYGANHPETRRERVRWFQTAHEILQHDWHEKIASWCRENSVQYTTEVPSMRATTQLYSDMPGGDSCHEKVGFPPNGLREANSHYRHDPRVPGALARQLNRKHAMIEAFHSVGWSMTLQDARCMIDRMTAMGIDTVVQHAFYYSTEGLRKHDAPPSQFFQMTNWPHYKALTDYAGRLSSMIAAGEPEMRVAIVDPVTTLWSLRGNALARYQYRGDDPKEKAMLERFLYDWRDMQTMLERHGVGFEPIDAEILNMAQIKDGQALIGRAAYDMIVLPPMFNIEGYAIEWLKRFIDSGGRVVSLGHAPNEALEDGDDVFGLRARLGAMGEGFFSDIRASYVHGCANAGFIAYGENGLEDGVRLLLHEIGQYAPQSFTIDTPPDAPILTRFTQLIDGGGVLFVSNLSKETYKLHPSFRAPYADSARALLNPEDGSCVNCPDEVELLPFSAVMILLGSEEAPHKEKLIAMELPAHGWTGEALSDNTLRLAEFEMHFDSPYGGQAVKAEVGTAASQFMNAADTKVPRVRMGSGFGIPPEAAVVYPIDITYKAVFYVDAMPSRMTIYWEDGALSEGAAVRINGKEAECGKTALPFIQLGENVLTVRLTAKSGSDGLRDPIYLEGDFGVFDGGAPHIGLAPAMTDPRLQVQPGYPYYSGEFLFKRKLDIPVGTEISAPWLDSSCHECAVLKTDTMPPVLRPWAPYAWRIEDAASEVCLTLTVPVIGKFEGRTFDYDQHKVVDVWDMLKRER